MLILETPYSSIWLKNSHKNLIIWLIKISKLKYYFPPSQFTDDTMNEYKRFQLKSQLYFNLFCFVLNVSLYQDIKQICILFYSNWTASF